MKASYFLASAVWLGLAGMANAQALLGSPVARDQTAGQGLNVVATDCSECRVRPVFPFLSGFGWRAAPTMRPSPMPPFVEATPTRDDVARMLADGGYSPAEITAAKIKVDEGQARSRQAAVRFLASVDFQYYPEAEFGLIAALRADRVESVRHEAVLAIANCRTLTPRMMDALHLAAQGIDLDGNPPETSDRVRSAARQILNQRLFLGWDMPWPGPMPGPTDWLASEINTTTFRPPVADGSSKDRELARTVSTTGHRPGQRSWAMSFLDSLSLRPSNSQGFSPGADPRMRGLAPLGSEGIAMPAPPASERSVYNRNR